MEEFVNRHFSNKMLLRDNHGKSHITVLFKSSKSLTNRIIQMLNIVESNTLTIQTEYTLRIVHFNLYNLPEKPLGQSE